MSTSCRLLLSAGLLAGAVLATHATVAADPPTRPAPPQRAPALPAASELLTARSPLLLDAAPAAPKSEPARGGQAAGRGELIFPPTVALRVSLEVLVGGRPLATVRHEGRTYLPVPRVGAEYEIRVWNHGPRRVAAVVSVDGLSVINGRPASADSPGYLVAPYSHVVIPGWRRSLDAVAAFRFVEREKSYAGWTGHPENVGVIGLVAIEEQVWRPRLEKAAAARRADAAVGGIGTEYGREFDSRAYYVPFVRSNNRWTVTIYYDTVEDLRAAGVPVDGPVPFPGDGEFAPPPPGYKGR